MAQDFEPGFVWTTKAWYSETALQHRSEHGAVSFGLYDDNDGGTSGEAELSWHDQSGVYLCPGLHPEARNVNRLTVWEDGYHLFLDIPRVFAWLETHTDQQFTEQEFVDALLALGFKDRTDYTSPYEREEAAQ
ncbi:MAG TPA: hypothetical protein VMW48_05230 [Vicinamibacterales bacterium]|nr:hypothetical protein [Vicinamibacterales bacterium]